jgi:hypothetical protein
MRRCFALLLLVGFLAPARDSSACQCGTKPSARDAYAASPLVALVRISRIEDQWTIWRKVKDWFRDRSQIDPEDYYRDYGFLITAQVLQQWKGDPIKSIQLATGRGGGDCGYSFQVGRTYLVYPASRADGGLRVSICGRITPGPDAGPDVQTLDAMGRGLSH